MYNLLNKESSLKSNTECGRESSQGTSRLGEGLHIYDEYM